MTKHIVSLICLLLLNYAVASAGPAAYKLISSRMESASIVRAKLMVYGQSKKTISNDARLAAVRIALFEGYPATAFDKPLLDDGEATSTGHHPGYFEALYRSRLNDFIPQCTALSEYKKGDKAKGTLYEIDINILQLRKDLEKNGIRKKMGI